MKTPQVYANANKPWLADTVFHLLTLSTSGVAFFHISRPQWKTAEVEMAAKEDSHARGLQITP